MIYRIVPTDDRNDFYAAGYDGNHFASEQEACEAIPELARCLESDPDGWTVVETAES